MGYHEPYRSSVVSQNSPPAGARTLTPQASQKDSLQALRDFEATISQERSNGVALGDFRFLDRTRIDLDATTTLLGCILWSDLSLASPHTYDLITSRLNDFRVIRGLTEESYQEMHLRDRRWLEESVAEIADQEPSRRVIILTHHAPTVSGTSAPHLLSSPDALTPAFSTPLESTPCCRRPTVTTWCFGHTHWSCDFVRKEVRFVSNQMGYRFRGENLEGDVKFDAGKCVSIDRPGEPRRRCRPAMVEPDRGCVCRTTAVVLAVGAASVTLSRR